MGNNTKIEWTDATWNPIRGCSRVSEGCRNCYADWTGKVSFVEDHLLEPCRWRKPRRIFVNSMSDLFHENVEENWIDQIFAVMAMCSRHTFQILTKRPERMLKYLTKFSTKSEWARYLSELNDSEEISIFSEDAECVIHNSIQGSISPPYSVGWPMRNVWLGVSVENQAAANERIPLLLQTPAAVRFISAEPLLGPIDLHGDARMLVRLAWRFSSSNGVNGSR
jgi:protein gp37